MKNREPWNFCETPKEKCTMNYCDENGCQNRKRNYIQGNDFIADVSGSDAVDINTQVEILKKVINKLMITFDDENDRMDYILDICNEYRKEAEKHCR